MCSKRAGDDALRSVVNCAANRLGERVSLEFRVEYFNMLNHPEFAQPTFRDGATNIKSPVFRQITSTGTFRGSARRIGELAAISLSHISFLKFLEVVV
jgi:hypothetical protein